MKSIPAKSVDLIICDLPYGCLSSKPTIVHQPGRAEPSEWKPCAWDIKIDLKAFWEQVKRIRKSDHSPTIHFCTTKFGFELHASNPEEFRYDLVWDKQRGVSFLTANKMPMRSHEMIYVFSKAGAFYQRKDILNGMKERPDRTGYIRPGNMHGAGVPIVCKKNNPTDRCVLSVIQTNASSKKGNHPTEKPEALYRFLIERYCPAGGTVLDPTFGSGNSVFTAFDMGRNAIGIEKDEKFFKKAKERLDKL
jgi:site-specific DNA-methyltransferase (adenine-specific)